MHAFLLCCAGAFACRRAPAPQESSREASKPSLVAPSDSAPLAAKERTTGASGTHELPVVPLPLHSPDLPRQLLTCDSKGFGRLTERGFEYYSTTELKRVTALELPDAHNAVRLLGSSVLIVARQHMYRYYHGQTKAVKFTRIPLLGPLQVFPDGRDIDAFWVRYLRDPELHHYRLEPMPGKNDEAALALDALPRAVTLGEAKSLPGFDGRRFALLADGALLYSAGDALRYAGSLGARTIESSRFEGSVAGLLPSPRLDRIWVLTEGGSAHQLEFSRGVPELERVDLGGTPLGFDAKEVLAVVTAQHGSGDGAEATRRDRLGVYRGGQRIMDVELPALGGPQTSSSRAEDNRCVCLFPERPWVLVGGRDLLQVYDYQKGTLLLQRLAE